MIAILGVYFSGTGNTKHYVSYFVKQCGGVAVSIEDADVLAQIAAHNMLVIGYPVYFSNAPKIMRDFITNHRGCFAGKKIYLIATMGLFSGDGTGCTVRLLHNATILGGLHLKMPNCIGDERLLKYSPEENRELIAQAEKKIDDAVSRLKAGNPHKDGLGLLAHVAGLFGQRLWFYGKTASYKEKPNIDREKCIGCGRCAELCPMSNLAMVDGKATTYNRCTL